MLTTVPCLTWFDTVVVGQGRRETSCGYNLADPGTWFKVTRRIDTLGFSPVQVENLYIKQDLHVKAYSFVAVILQFYVSAGVSPLSL